ncbi:hypothetical protein F4604DRAFT_1933729 [Suillus subluteus]|nr:hypothetical protein F4604DRAFT_1933729 [Suillus subluteus]
MNKSSINTDSAHHQGIQLPAFNQNMQQSSIQRQTFNLSGHVISLNLQTELAGNSNHEPEQLTVRGGTSSAETNKAPHLLLEKNSETGEADSIAKLKEQLRLAEFGCSRLEDLYQKYRLRWLEESYRAKVLEEYAPSGISICSSRQIMWDAPSPIHSNDAEVEDQECEEDRWNFCGSAEHIGDPEEVL